MRSLRRRWWLRLAVGILTVPLLATSCVDIVQRAAINGFFDAVIPIADERLGACLAADANGATAP